MSEVFSIQLSNHTTQLDGKTGVWLDLPATAEQVRAAMGQIGVTQDNPWDYFISGFSSPEDRHLAIPYDMALASGVNELNFLAARLEKPELAQEWSEKNEIKPTEVSVGSHKKVIWKCRLGHEWEASIKSRTINGTGCPYCSHNKVLEGFNDLASQMPEVAAEWSEKNYPLLPTMVTPFANKKVWWKCGKGHEWHKPLVS